MVNFIKTRILSSCCKVILRDRSNPLYSKSQGLKALSTHAQPIVNPAQENAQISETQSLNPLHHEDFFGVKKMVSVKDLFEARVHLGHREGSLNENMSPYIFGSRLGHLIFDLDKTVDLLHQALNFAAHIAYRDGIILFITQCPQHSYLIEETAAECKEFAHTRPWRQGMFTNSKMMYGAVTRLPDLVIFFNTLTTVLEEHWAVKEAAKMAIPSIGVVDTNCSPNLITYPVPGNDDTPVAVELYCKLFKQVILKGKSERNKVLALCAS